VAGDRVHDITVMSDSPPNSLALGVTNIQTHPVRIRGRPTTDRLQL